MQIKKALGHIRGFMFRRRVNALGRIKVYGKVRIKHPVGRITIGNRVTLHPNVVFDFEAAAPGTTPEVTIGERTAIGDRSMTANLNANMSTGTGDPTNTAVRIASSLDRDSRDQGEMSRQGRLHTVMSVRVVGFERGGLARVAGTRRVSVDGQAQEVGLEGVVRPDDVTAGNLVESNRIADAVITYKGKKIGPGSGIMGKLLGMLWP